MAPKTYTYIQDPGHGWLQVPLSDLPEGFRPSSFSFLDSRFAYLEEDCDFPAFAAIVAPFEVRGVIVDDFDRGQQRFPQVERGNR